MYTIKFMAYDNEERFIPPELADKPMGETLTECRDEYMKRVSLLLLAKSFVGVLDKEIEFYLGIISPDGDIVLYTKTPGFRAEVFESRPDTGQK